MYNNIYYLQYLLERKQSEAPRRASAMTANLMERVAELEKRINECCESIGKNDGVVQDQVCTSLHRSKQLLFTSCNENFFNVLMYL